MQFIFDIFFKEKQMNKKYITKIKENFLHSFLIIFLHPYYIFHACVHVDNRFRKSTKLCMSMDTFFQLFSYSMALVSVLRVIRIKISFDNCYLCQ